MILAFVSVLSTTICLLLTPHLVLSSTEPAVSRPTDDGPSPPESGPSATGQLKLFQLNPVEKGHVQDFTFQSGHVIHLKTLAIEPLLFEIPGFLSDEECDHIKQLALEKGLFKSPLKRTREDEEEQDSEEDLPWQEVFRDIDANKDGVLDVQEILETLDVTDSNTFLRAEDTRDMIRDLRLDLDGDDVLSLEEFSNIDGGKMNEIKEWVGQQSKDETRLNRVSQQTWLSQDDGSDKVLADLKQRASELTRLPQGIVKHSEKLQVVYYEPGGHFHAHYDSEEITSDQRCSHTSQIIPEDDTSRVDVTLPRLCRFITILYYLDDTEEGGETAFPIADNETFSEENLGVNTSDLSRHCHDANLYVRPEKGKAVMWYNHYINQTTGWLGPMNPYSLHGGCDVRRGTKWIANNWITVDDSLRRQRLYMQAMDQQTERQSDSGDDGKDDEGFHRALDDLRGIWLSYLRSSGGLEAARNFLGEEEAEITPDVVVDVLADYTEANAAEIHQARRGDVDPDGTCPYSIVWHRQVDEAQHGDDDHHQPHLHAEESAADMTAFVLMACAHGSRSKGNFNPSTAGETLASAPARILKNPGLAAGGGNGEDPDAPYRQYPSNGLVDGPLEKRTTDEL